MNQAGGFDLHVPVDAGRVDIRPKPKSGDAAIYGLRREANVGRQLNRVIDADVVIAGVGVAALLGFAGVGLRIGAGVDGADGDAVGAGNYLNSDAGDVAAVCGFVGRDLDHVAGGQLRADGAVDVLDFEGLARAQGAGPVEVGLGKGAYPE